jgi:altronate dehydratase
VDAVVGNARAAMVEPRRPIHTNPSHPLLPLLLTHCSARRFLEIIQRFKDRLAWHGQSAESNPSGGNNYRGLYNIGLKSLGAAKKKHAEQRLDGVLEYAEPCGVDKPRGYYMMDR